MLPRLNKLSTCNKLGFAATLAAVVVALVYVVFFRQVSSDTLRLSALRKDSRVDIRAVLASSVQAVKLAGRK